MDYVGYYNAMLLAKKVFHIRKSSLYLFSILSVQHVARNIVGVYISIN